LRADDCEKKPDRDGETAGQHKSLRNVADSSPAPSRS
jgi:hypothetical protein